MNIPSTNSQSVALLIELIEEYLSAVNRLSSHLVSALHLENLVDWRSKGITACGTISSELYYAFHGSGCYVRTSDIEVDFDFGPRGETDGFDGWRLWLFVCDNKSLSTKFSIFLDKKSILSVLDMAVSIQLIERREDLFYLKSLEHRLQI